MVESIRVDQSHCNYRLSHWLKAKNWDVVFRDPGRVSRGLTGTQERLLGIFERNSWPIPDIVAISNEKLLFVEIDHRIQVAESSFIRYRQSADSILSAINEMQSDEMKLKSLSLGFCKIGTIKNPAQQLSGLDFLAWFDDAMIPSVLWK